MAGAVAQQVPHPRYGAVPGHVIATAVVAADDAARRAERGLGHRRAGHGSSPVGRPKAPASVWARKDTVTASAISGVTHHAPPAPS